MKVRANFSTLLNGHASDANRQASLLLAPRHLWGASNSCNYSTKSPSGGLSPEEAARASKEQQFLQMVLSRFLPEEDFKDVQKTRTSDRLRFADLPVMQNFMESFVSDKNSNEPVYDLPTWIANNAVAFDTQPKSPWYSWLLRLRTTVPRDQQRLFLSFDDHLSHETMRKKVMLQAQFELARLWDWQHRRVAAAKPPTFSERELAAVAAAEAEVEASLKASEPMTLDEAIAAAGMNAQEPPPMNPERSITDIVNEAIANGPGIDDSPISFMDKAGLTQDQKDFLKSTSQVTDAVRINVARLQERWARGKGGAARMHKVTGVMRAEYEDRMDKADDLEAQGTDASHLFHHDKKLLGGDSSSVLAGSALTDAIQGKQYWDQMEVLSDRPTDLVMHRVTDEEEHLRAKERSKKAKFENFRKRMKKEAEQGWFPDLQRFNEHGYAFSLAVRPPTPTLDMLFDYLELRYADVLARKSTLDHVLGRMHTLDCAQIGETSSSNRSRAVLHTRAWLAPQEVEEVNTVADELFKHNPTEYIRFVDRLFTDGVISSPQAEELRRAAALRRAELGSALPQHPHQEVNAAAAATTTQERMELFEVLSGRRPLTSVTGFGPNAALAAAAWQAAAPEYAEWATSTAAAARDQIKAARESGAKISSETEAQWIRELSTPLSFDDASRAWAEVTAHTGTLAAPLLSDVIVADIHTRGDPFPTIPPPVAPTTTPIPIPLEPSSLPPLDAAAAAAAAADSSLHAPSVAVSTAEATAATTNSAGSILPPLDAAAVAVNDPPSLVSTASPAAAAAAAADVTAAPVEVTTPTTVAPSSTPTATSAPSHAAPAATTPPTPELPQSHAVSSQPTNGLSTEALAVEPATGISTPAPTPPTLTASTLEGSAAVAAPTAATADASRPAGEPSAPKRKAAVSKAAVAPPVQSPAPAGSILDILAFPSTAQPASATSVPEVAPTPKPSKGKATSPVPQSAAAAADVEHPVSAASGTAAADATAAAGAATAAADAAADPHQDSMKLRGKANKAKSGGRGANTAASPPTGSGTTAEFSTTAGSDDSDQLTADFGSSLGPYQRDQMDQMASMVQGQLRELYEAAQAGSVGMLLPDWEELEAANDSVDLRDLAQLEQRFQAASLQDVLRHHWESVSRPALSDTTQWSAVTWDDLYGLMKQAAEHTGSENAAEGTEAEGDAEESTLAAIMGVGRGSSTDYPVAGYSPAADLLLPGADSASSAGPTSSITSIISSNAAGVSSSGEDVSTQAGDEHAGGPDPLVAPDWADSLAHLQAALGVGPSARDLGPRPPTPPYPGARKLLRFTQTFVLHAAAEEKDHPHNREVFLRVHAGELAGETGLSGEALQHMLRICGKERYDSKTGDIILSSKQYTKREENRKHLLETLNRLIYEGQRQHPSKNFLFNRLPNPFAPH